LQNLDPELEQRGCAHNREGNAAPGGVLLGRVLHPEEFHGSVSSGADRREQHEPSAGGLRGVDQVGVAVAVNRRKGIATGISEPVHRGDDHVDASRRRSKAGPVAHVARDGGDPIAQQVRRARGLASEDSDLMPGVDQALHDEGAETTGAARDQDHD
jgi:hypothetical protein